MLCVLGCQTRSSPPALSPGAQPTSPVELDANDRGPQAAEPTHVQPTQPEPHEGRPTPRRRLADFVQQHDPLRLEFTTFHWTLGDGVPVETGPAPALQKRRPALPMTPSALRDSGDASVLLPVEIGEYVLTRAIDHGDHQVGLYEHPTKGVSLLLAADSHGVVLSYLDFEGYRFAPGTSIDDVPSQDQRLLWAEVREGVLFVAQAHAAPVRDKRKLNAYLGAFEAGTGKLLWRTEGLVVNAENFVFHGGYLLTGYGEAAPGKSAVHAVRATDGSVERRVRLRSRPRWFAVVGGRLRVQTDDAVFSLEL